LKSSHWNYKYTGFYVILGNVIYTYKIYNVNVSVL
jgi:hypothetical protein